VRLLVGIFLVVTGCYERAYEQSCEVPCSSGVCPSGLSCGTDGVCRGPGVTSCDDAAVRVGDSMVGGDASPCFGDSRFTYCFTALPTASLSLTGPFDTATDPRCTPVQQASAGPVCVIAGKDVTIGALRATGTPPLVVIAVGQLQVVTALDVSSDAVSGGRGAGAEPSDCPPGTILPVASGNGGGAGGTFGTSGGAGGAGSGHAGSTPTLPDTLKWVRGGCPGMQGGADTLGNGGGIGGLGGGAVYLIAGNLIDITGKINASGGGGGGASNVAGGGGGGAGGAIGLVAPMISGSTNAEIYANGGGGGGATCTANPAGGRGGISLNAAMAKGGLAGSPAAGAGGIGGYGISAAQIGGAATGGASICGGGGGGGGVGIIHTTGTVMSGPIYSPPPSS